MKCVKSTISQTVSGVQWCNAEGLNLVSLDADLKAVFPDSQVVDDALRELLRLRESEAKLAKAS